MNDQQQEFLRKAREHAELKEGKCLSSEYINAKIKLEWKCSNNQHKSWFACYNVVMKGHWCKECGIELMAQKRRKPNGLQVAKKYAESKGGKCLSLEYISSRIKLEWKCSNDQHKSWFAAYDSVINNGNWCRKCGSQQTAKKRKNPKGLENAQKYAESKGGKCLSTVYINSKENLEWKCSNNEHKSWLRPYVAVSRGSWCPTCAGLLPEEERLLEAKEYANKRDGKCLSNTFKGIEHKLEWKCSNNEHRAWLASLYSIKKGSWCPQCAGFSTPKERLDKAKEHAESKGGKCLSSYYKNAHTKLEWECIEKHIWKASYAGVVLLNNWCPQCSFYHYKEHKIRDLLEYLLDTKFEKTKLTWNINPKTNKLLELDGYSKELNLAFEFQGKHHYEENVYGNSSENLNYIKYKDEIKKQNCEKNNVNLIIVDDKFKLNQEKEILNYILSLLKEKNIEVKKEIKQSEIDLIFKRTIKQQQIYLKKAQEYAISKGGECLSTQYSSAKDKLKWKCIDGHEWDASFDKVTRGGWCPKCVGRFPKETYLEKAKDYAISKGGECLSDEYVKSSAKMEWKCANNHKSWFDSYNSVVIRNHWCKDCQKITKKEPYLEKAKDYAINKDGECLSIKYENRDAKLKWKCNNKNHNPWFSSCRMVINKGYWCPLCTKETPKINH